MNGKLLIKLWILRCCWILLLHHHCLVIAVSLPLESNRYLKPKPQLVLDRLSVYGSTLLSLVFDGTPIDKALIQLGPTAIKVGQSLASRPDLIGLQFATSLQGLQDSIPPSLTYEQVEMILLKSQFNASINMTSLSRAPVAAASIAQVHRATLLDEANTPVALKIQRPFIKDIVGCDLFLAGLLAKAIQPFLKSKAVEAVDELALRIFEEMDFRNEAKNLLLFSSLYDVDKGGIYASKLPFPGVSTPQLYPNLCNEQILTMGYIDGKKLVKYDRIPREQLLQITTLGLRCSLSQLLESGILHADTHGGNMMIDQNGRLCYLDFGLVAQIPRSVRIALLCAVIHLVEQDFCALASEFDDLMLLSSEDLRDNKVQLENSLRDLVSNIFVFGSEAVPDSYDFLSKMPTLKFDKLVSSLSSIAAEFPFKSPPYFLNNVRAIGALEGMALTADANFNLFRIVYPFMISRIFSELDDPKVNRLFRGLILSKETGLVNWTRAIKLVRQACAVFGVKKRDLFASFITTKAGPRLLMELTTRYIKCGIRRIKAALTHFQLFTNANGTKH